MKKIFDGIYSDGKDIYTVNLIPGKKVYIEKLAIEDGKEYREWVISKSKLAAAIKKGLKNQPIKDKSIVLYLGASTGTTVSHISDIIGKDGAVYAVEFAERVFRELMGLAESRKNIIPILSDARRINEYEWIEECDIVFCDLAQPDETQIMIKNANEFLKDKGFVMISVKSQSIDVTKKPGQVYKEEADKLRKAGFKVLETINLEPYEAKHAMIVAKKD